MASVGVGLLALVVLVGVSGVWAVAIPPSVLISLLPRFYFARVRARRLSEVRKAWPDGIRDIIGGVSSGMSVQRALENLARSGPAPLREAFGRFPVLARTLGVAAALESIKEDLSDPTSDRVLEVLMIAHDRGGALIPDILRDLADSTSMDLAATEEEQTEALEQRINARVVFMLPWLVLVALTFRPGPFRTFYSSPAGMLVVAIGAALSLFGIAIISRLSQPQDEPRVLTSARGGTKGW
jgi:tight adherence protein B